MIHAFGLLRRESRKNHVEICVDWCVQHLCKQGVPFMPSNLAIDDELLEEAKRIGGHRTKKATVNEALLEYIQRRKRRAIIELFGQVDFDPRHDYKRARRR